MTDTPKPPGPPVKWETISREYDRDDRLISERVTVVTDTQLDHPKPELNTGHYL